MLLSEYETTVVLRPDIGGESIESTLDRVRNAVADGGKLLAINHWGKKRLAYEIGKHNRGVYVHTHYLGAGNMVAELERNLRLNENVLRFLTVKLEDAVAPDAREAHDYVQPEYDAADDVDEEEETMEAMGSDDDEGGRRRRDDDGDNRRRDDDGDSRRRDDDEDEE